jgi:hypothetical protein
MHRLEKLKDTKGVIIIGQSKKDRQHNDQKKKYKQRSQSVPIIIKVASSDPAYDEMFSIQHYVIKFVIDLRQVGGFLMVLWFSPPIKLIATI